MEGLYFFGVCGGLAFIAPRISQYYADRLTRAKPLVSPLDIKAAEKACEDRRAERGALAARRNAAETTQEYAALRKQIAAMQSEIDSLAFEPVRLKKLLLRQIALGMSDA